MTSEILLKRETIEREQFIELLAGRTEEEVFDALRSSRLATRRPRRERAGRGARPGPDGQPAPARAPA
jgi:cell division protease FtsH